MNCRCFCWFPVAIFVYQNCTQIWRLHTKLCNGAWNVLANNSETVGHIDLRLRQIVYILVFCNISSTGWFPVYFFVLCLLHDSENDLQGLLRTFFMLNTEWTNFKNVSLSQFLNGNESYARTFWELKWHETWAKEVLVDGNYYYYFLIYAKLFPYTISDSESQTPLLRFFLRGGRSVHRL